MIDLFLRIVDLKKQNKIFCIVTVVATKGNTPRKAGARGLVFPDGSIEGTVGGGSIEVEAINTAQQVLKTGKPLFKDYILNKDLENKMICGGSMSLFYEPVYPEKRLTIFGGGHVGRAIAPVAQIAGWRVKVVDHRKEVLDPNLFSNQVELITADYADFIKATSFDSNDWLVIVTHKHKYDEQVLELSMQYPVAYLGMIGSNKKVSEVINNLKRKGINEELLARVYAPIGLNIGTETPGEIAIAIVAEMLAVLHGITEVRSCTKLN